MDQRPGVKGGVGVVFRCGPINPRRRWTTAVEEESGVRSLKLAFCPALLRGPGRPLLQAGNGDLQVNITPAAARCGDLSLTDHPGLLAPRGASSAARSLAPTKAVKNRGLR